MLALIDKPALTAQVVTALLLALYVIIQLVRMVKDKKNGAHYVGFSQADRDQLHQAATTLSRLVEWHAACDDEGRPLAYFPRREFYELAKAIRKQTVVMSELLVELRSVHCPFSPQREGAD